jgi:nucleoside-diphosphate-sugar epimerase
MTNVVVTGGAGFLGARLARELLAAGELGVAGDPPDAVGRLTIVDRVPIPRDLAADSRVSAAVGDLPSLLADGAQAGPLAGADVVFHLAAAVSGECEADFDLGMHANLRATQAVLAACRALGTTPVVVYASSLAVFGGSAMRPLPAVVDDNTAPNPQTSYGAQKAIGEHLLADYTRKGFLRGRAIRPVTISVRAGRPNAAASGFLSGIIREPLAGQRATCPVGPEIEVALASPAKAVTAFLRAATSSEQAWADPTAVTMPALTVTVGEMVAALERVAGPEVAALVDWVPDPAIADIVTGWPARVRADRAARLGLTPDPDFESIVRMHAAQFG